MHNHRVESGVDADLATPIGKPRRNKKGCVRHGVTCHGKAGTGDNRSMSEPCIAGISIGQATAFGYGRAVSEERSEALTGRLRLGTSRGEGHR